MHEARWRGAAPGAALLVVLLAAAPAAAQDYPPLSVEGRAGVAVPMLSFREGPDRGGTIDRAPSFGLHFVFRGMSGWGPYIGFSQHRFDCTADGCAEDAYVATLWDLGAQRTFGQKGRVWLRAGLVVGRMERDFLEGGPNASAGGRRRGASLLSLGAEGGAGIRVPIREWIALTPGVRFGWLDTQFREGPLARVRWVTADLGVALGF